MNKRDGHGREGTSQRLGLCACSQAGDLGQTTLPFTNKRGRNLPLSLLLHCSMTQEQRKEKKVFVWSLHHYAQATLLNPSSSPALLGAQGAPGCCCMSDRAGRQTKMDLKLLLLTQEEKRLKQMGNRMANSTGAITGNSRCNRVSLGASCGVVMLLYS